MRSADGFGVDQVYLTGYTPYPEHKTDKRLPHIVKKTSGQIAKTALGAEKTLKWQYAEDVIQVLQNLRNDGFLIAALEQTAAAVELPKFKTSKDTVLIVGSEVGGLEPEVLNIASVHLTIPMLGFKESFNVSVAAAVALYHLRWYNQKSNGR